MAAECKASGTYPAGILSRSRWIICETCGRTAYLNGAGMVEAHDAPGERRVVRIDDDGDVPVVGRVIEFSEDDERVLVEWDGGQAWENADELMPRGRRA